MEVGLLAIAKASGGYRILGLFSDWTQAVTERDARNAAENASKPYAVIIARLDGQVLDSIESGPVA